MLETIKKSMALERGRVHDWVNGTHIINFRK
jgi:hypothetical protein